jgi:hypothetical protein
MAKRLKKLRIDEVSVVTAAANPGARVAIMKRVTGFDDTGELLIDGVPRWRRKKMGGGAVAKVDTSTSVERALAEIEETKRFAKAHAAVTEVIPMETQDVTKAAAAVAVVKRFDGIIAEIAKRHNITPGAALLKVAQDREMSAEWFAYRQAQQIDGAQVRAAPEPEPVVESDAYQTMMAKATKRSARHGTSVASEFSQIFAQRPDLAAEDRAFHFSKAGTRPA